MKKVIVMAVISILTFHASAQSNSSVTQKNTKPKMETPEKSRVISKNVAREDRKKTKPAFTSNVKPNTSKKGQEKVPTGTTNEETITLTNESEHKAKSTFAEILEKRTKIDAQDEASMKKPKSGT